MHQMTIGRQRIAPVAEPGHQNIPNLVSPQKVQGLYTTQDRAAHLQGIARDWAGMLTIDRVVAYCFRGDTRDYNGIKTAGGFFPPSTRNDQSYLEGAVFENFQAYMSRRWNVDVDLKLYKKAIQNSMDADARQLFIEYSTWRALVATEEMHLGRMLANEVLKGYISTTRAVTTAKNFATKFCTRPGYVYVVLVRGGYLVPPQGQKMKAWTQFFNEQEVAYPGAILWPDVVGWRQVQANGKFTGAVCLRPDFYNYDYQAWEKVFALLSGKKQT